VRLDSAISLRPTSPTTLPERFGVAHRDSTKEKDPPSKSAERGSIRLLRGAP
jgi:hypothetical protein